MKKNNQNKEFYDEYNLNCYQKKTGGFKVYLLYLLISIFPIFNLIVLFLLLSELRKTPDKKTCITEILIIILGITFKYLIIFIL